MGVVHKWKGTRKICCCWPLYSESLTVTDEEVHVKRNDCPALPRECRPYRSWATANLNNISAFRMSKKIFQPSYMISLIIFSLVAGFLGGMLFFVIPPATLADIIKPENVVQFLIYSIIICAAACCVGLQIINLCAPLRLTISIDGNNEWFSLDLVSGVVQPEEIKAAIEDASSANNQA